MNHMLLNCDVPQTVKLFTMFMILLFSVSVYTKIYKRSVSTFIAISGITISGICFYYVGYYAMHCIALTMIIMVFRAVYKPDTDKLIVT